MEFIVCKILSLMKDRFMVIMLYYERCFVQRVECFGIVLGFFYRWEVVVFDL